MKITILGKTNLYIILTKNIYIQEEVEKMRTLLESYDWDRDGWIMLPSEYIEKIEVIKRQ